MKKQRAEQFGSEYIYISGYWEVRDAIECAGLSKHSEAYKHRDEVTGLFVFVEDGAYEDIWYTYSCRPFESLCLYKKAYIRK